MVWQERSAIIVMITKEVERGRVGHPFRYYTNMRRMGGGLCYSCLISSVIFGAFDGSGLNHGDRVLSRDSELRLILTFITALSLGCGPAVPPLCSQQLCCKS